MADRFAAVAAGRIIQEEFRAITVPDAARYFAEDILAVSSFLLFLAFTRHAIS